MKSSNRPSMNLGVRWLVLSMFLVCPAGAQEPSGVAASFESEDSPAIEPTEAEAAEGATGAFAGIAPGGRVEGWIRERLNKATRSEPARPSWIEKGLVAVESGGPGGFFGLDLGGVKPRIGGLPSGAGIALGARYRVSRPNDALGLDVETGWSAKDYQKHRVRFGRLEDVPFDSPGGFGYGEIGYLHYPEEDFYGAGPVQELVRADFLLNRTDYSLVGGYRFSRWLRVRGSYTHLDVEVAPGEDRRFPDLHAVLDDRFAPGLARQPDFGVISYSVVADTRGQPGSRNVGSFFEATVSHYEDQEDAGFGFRRFEVDARRYLALGSPSRVLALRGLGSRDVTGPSQRVPFYFWPTLGGSRTLRGFEPYRFRGDDLLYFSTEYRWEPVPAVELAVFYDVGRVTLSGATASTPFEHSTGGGLRFKSLNGVLFRLDVAHSREGTRVIIDFGPSF